MNNSISQHKNVCQEDNYPTFTWTHNILSNKSYPSQTQASSSYNNVNVLGVVCQINEKTQLQEIRRMDAAHTPPQLFENPQDQH